MRYRPDTLIGRTIDAAIKQHFPEVAGKVKARSRKDLLRELWSDPSYTVAEMADEFPVGKRTVYRWARREGLPIPRPR
jgi:hypothetical protein